MSRSFYIENPQSPKVLTISDILEAVPNFIQYDYQENDADFQEFMATPLNVYGSVLFGQEGISGRGFAVSYDEEVNAYGVRFFTPCTKADWLGGFEFIKYLAKHLSVNQVVDEEENVYPADNISYEYWEEIAFGVQTYEGKETENFFLFGVNRPISLNEEIIRKLLSASDRVQAFSEFVENQQYPKDDPYIAKQQFYKNQNGEILGVYSLTQTVPTVLPYEYPPFIDITQCSINQEDVKEWQIHFVAIEGDDDAPNSYKSVGDMDYQTFLERLPQEKIQKLDGHYMQICFHTKEEMKAILEGKSAPKKGFFGKLKGLF